MVIDIHTVHLHSQSITSLLHHIASYLAWLAIAYSRHSKYTFGHFRKQQGKQDFWPLLYHFLSTHSTDSIAHRILVITSEALGRGLLAGVRTLSPCLLEKHRLRHLLLVMSLLRLREVHAMREVIKVEMTMIGKVRVYRGELLVVWLSRRKRWCIEGES